VPSPFSHDNDALQAAVKGLHPGMFTGLWDALYYEARYLEGRDQRKVLGDPRRLLAAAEAESWITA
jgi:hypothetical protein